MNLRKGCNDGSAPTVQVWRKSCICPCTRAHTGASHQGQEKSPSWKSNTKDFGHTICHNQSNRSRKVSQVYWRSSSESYEGQNLRMPNRLAGNFSLTSYPYAVRLELSQSGFQKWIHKNRKRYKVKLPWTCFRNNVVFTAKHPYSTH